VTDPAKLRQSTALSRIMRLSEKYKMNQNYSTSNVLYILKSLKSALETDFGITKIAIFGSFSLENQNSNSDLDLLILEMNRRNGFIVARAKTFLEDKLNLKIDIGFYSSLNPYIQKEIKDSLIHV